MSIADTIVVMNRGRIEDSGPPSRVYLRPASLFSATFMGESNVLPGRVVESGGGSVMVETRLGGVRAGGSAAPGASVYLSIRPEQITLAPPPDRTVSLGKARVVELSFQGAHLRCHARAGPDGAIALVLRLPAGAPVAVDQSVPLYARSGDIVVLPG